MKQPRVSILIPVYNVAPWLAECLDSILAQTMKDFEVICVNDGSTDNSLDILKEYALSDSRIRIFSQENRGLSGARNTAAHFAKGKWLYFMDSDDKLKPEALEELCSYGETHDLQLVYMNVEVFADSPEWEAQAQKNYEEYYRPRASYPGVYTGKELYCLFRENYDFVAPVWTYFILHEYYTVQNLNFYQGILREDEVFHRKALLDADRVGKIDSPLICYRVRSGSIMTQKRTIRHVGGGLALFMELCCRMDENTNDTRLYQILYHDLCQFMGYVLDDYRQLSPENQKDLSPLPDGLRPLAEVLLRDTTLFSNGLRLLLELDHSQQKVLIAEQEVNRLKCALECVEKEAALARQEADHAKQEATLARQEADHAKQEVEHVQQDTNLALTELDKANRENIRLQTTLSYRLGRVITTVPRKIRDTLKKEKPL